MQAWDRQHRHITLENGTRGWRRLRLACEAAKRELTSNEVTSIDLSDLAGGEVMLRAQCCLIAARLSNCCRAMYLGYDAMRRWNEAAATDFLQCMTNTPASAGSEKPPVIVPLAPWFKAAPQASRDYYNPCKRNEREFSQPAVDSKQCRRQCGRMWLRYCGTTCRTCTLRSHDPHSSSRWNRCCSAAWM